MENKLSWNNFYRHPRFWRHFAAWAVFLGFVLLLIGVDLYSNPGEDYNSNDDGADGFFKFLLELLVLIYGSFTAYNIFKPQKKYGLLFVSLITIVVLVSFVDDWWDTSSVVIGELTGFWANILIFPVFLVIAFGIKLAYHGSRQIFVIDRLEAKQTESELKLLKSQINPHFLFNTLNNIYSTNLDDHDKANEIILELADLLRYQLESNKKTKTSLQEEIDSLNNYVALEKIRVRDCDINVVSNGNTADVEIVPLLLLPFVENAFKYGTGIERGEIEIRFDIEDQTKFNFYCKNKIVQKKGRIHSGGIGLENVKKRLDLMYKNKYTLSINNENDYFVVDLNIQL